MSVENAKKFLKEIETNPKLREKVIPYFDFEKNKWQTDEFIRVANEEGYAFDADDLDDATQELYGGELSEEQLEMIAGGGCCCCAASSSCCC